ncbi:unnamed protein product [Closterium sp. NIES-54]
MNHPPTFRELAAMVPPVPFAQILAPNAAHGQVFYGFAAPPPAPSPSPAPSTFPSSFATTLSDMAILNRAAVPVAPPATISQMSLDPILQMTPELVRQIHLLARSQGAPCFPQGGGGDARSDRTDERGNGGSGGSASSTIAAAAAAAAAAASNPSQLSSAFADRNGSFGSLPFSLSGWETAVGRFPGGTAATNRGILEQPARSDYLLQTQHPLAPFKSFAPFDSCAPVAPSAPSAQFAASRGFSAFQQPSGFPQLTAAVETGQPVTRQPLTRRPSADGATETSVEDMSVPSSRRGLKRTGGPGAISGHNNGAASAAEPATTIAPSPASAARRRRGGSSSPAVVDGASSGGSSSGGGNSPRAGEEPAEAAGATAPAVPEAAAEATAAATAAWEQHQWSRGLAELVSADGHRWLKYGAKKLSTKNGGQRRAYYRCAASSPHHRTAGSAPCPARKVVNSHPLRPFDLSAVTVEYLSEHNHSVEGGRLVVRDYKGRRVPHAGDDGAAAGEDGAQVASADVSPSVAADGEAWTAAGGGAAAAAAAAGDDTVVLHNEFPFGDTPQLRDFMGVGGKESSQGICPQSKSPQRFGGTVAITMYARAGSPTKSSRQCVQVAQLDSACLPQ